MIRKTGLYLSFVFLFLFGFYQPVRSYIVTGTVRDIGGATVSSAQVTFILVSDTTIAFHSLTNQYGNYMVSIPGNPTFTPDLTGDNISGSVALFQNYPNPFNTVTCLSFKLEKPMTIRMAVTDVLGRTCRILINRRMDAGTHIVMWDGLCEGGMKAGAGLYFCRMEAGGNVYTIKMILSDGTADRQVTNPSMLKSTSRDHTITDNNMYNVVITGKGIIPFTRDNVEVEGDIQHDFTVERAPTGKLVSDKSLSLDGGSQGDDAAYGFILDEDDNIYITGFVTITDEGRNIWLAKYDSQFNPVTDTIINGSADGEDTGYTFALDENGNLYIIGYITETGQDHNIWIAKYDPDLYLQKEITVNGSKNETDDGYGILYDGNGHLYAAGTVREIEGENNIWLAKYDTDLNLIRSITMNQTDNMTDKARFMVLDGNGHLFVSGSVTQEISDYDIWIGKFDTDLNLIKDTAIAGPVAGEEDKGYGICLDEFGILYCTGTLTEPDQGYNIWLAKFDTALNPIGNITMDGPLHGEDVAYMMKMDDSGFLYLTGVYTEPSGNENLWIGIYNRDLQLMSYTTVNGSADEYDSGIGIDCRQNDIYVSGFLTETAEGSNIWFTRYILSDP
ncbi:MAG: T9SS type A sorting domain-containing protein [Bacteroidales bacterium]|nr:T9SS type A sorting domain-containing protein [Bacteroidales bacterium]